MTLASELLEALAARGLSRDTADEDVLSVVASVVAVAGMRPLPGLHIELTDRTALISFLAEVVEVGTLEAAVAR